MFKQALLKVADKDEIRKQFKEKLPPNHQEEEKRRWAPVYPRLAALIEVLPTAGADIQVSKDYELTLKKDLDIEKKYQEYLQALQNVLNTIVTTGRHFNPQLIEQVFKDYSDYFKNNSGDAFNPDCIFFWQRIIGGIQRLMTSIWMSIFCHHGGMLGVIKYLLQDKPLIRGASFHNPGKPIGAVYPLIENKGIGYDYAVIRGQAMQTIGGIIPASLETFRQVVQLIEASIERLFEPEIKPTETFKP